MQVRKRNGSLEPVNLEKIVNSIRRVCEDLPNVEPMKIAQKVVGGLVDGVSTRDLDMQSIRTAVNLIIEDPVYSKVAGRILSNVIGKEVSGQDIQSFSQCIQLGFDQGLIDEKTKNLVMTNKRKLNDRVRPERDWNFEYHGVQTVYDRYLLRHRTQTISKDSKQRVVIETPQYFLMRVACGLANDATEAVELYDLLSSLEYMTSTPTLFNSGTVHSQMSSCYLLDSPIDDIEDIYKRYSDIASLSKFAGGIGVSYSRIRSKGTLIKGTNGKSNGLIPWLHTLSGSVAAVNQCLHPDTKVYTSIGMKNIKDIKINDLVLGISGNYRPVQEVLKYNASNERSLSITINNYDNPIVITDGHPIYTITKIDVSHDPSIEDYNLLPRWLEGKDLKIGDLVGIPKTKNEKFSHDFEYGDFTWSKITNIQEVETPATVYDLRVETDETYVVEGALVHNGGKRKGAACVYIEPWHPDIMSFLELRDQTGEKESRAYNLNIANWIPDLFMKRVEEDGMWSLIDPSVGYDLPDIYGDEFDQRYTQLEADGKYVEQIPARKLYARMMRTLAETGNGWMCFKDTSNKRGNQVGEGRIIHLSNLCVAPETLLLTNNGHQPIKTLKDQEVTIWNGFEWSNVIVRQTGKNEDLVTVTFSDGNDLTCTPYHKFYIDNNGNVEEVRACDLLDGHRIIKHDLPVIEGHEEFPHAYTHGFFCGDGTYTTSKKPKVALYAGKKQLETVLETKSGSGLEDSNSRLTFMLPDTLNQKFEVPSAKFSIKSRVDWITGLLDADGTTSGTDTSRTIQLGSINREFLIDVSLMLQTLGIASKVTLMRETSTVKVRQDEKEYVTQPMFRLHITTSGSNKLLSLGAKFNRLKVFQQTPNRDARRFVTVTSVEYIDRKDDTYCVSEPKRHMAVFNGVLTGQCTEILEVTSSGTKELITRDELSSLTNEDMVTQNIRVVGFNTKEDKFEIIKGSEVSVCNLGSINLGRNYVKNGKLDKAKLRKNVAIAVKYLDRVIDRNFYPIPEAKASNMRWRPIGLGEMGLADLLLQLKLPFESEEAIKISAEVQEEIYYQAVKTSCELAKELGKHRDFELTRAAQGLLQFDLAGVTPKDTARWDALKEDIRTHGLRNSLLLAIAPTATISHICGAEECIEPYKSNLLKRETLSGEFIAINKYLVDDLKSIGRWDDATRTALIRDEGSLKNLDLPLEIKALYPTVWEISMKSIIAHAAARGAYIDQSASTNLFVDLNQHPEDKRIALLSSMYRAVWKAGLKTTYYFRSRSATRIEQTTVAPTATVSLVAMAPEETEVCESCT